MDNKQLYVELTEMHPFVGRDNQILRINHTNVSAQPNFSHKTHIDLMIIPYADQSMGICRDCFVKTGIMQFKIKTPLNQGLVEMLEIADYIAHYYDHLEKNGVHYLRGAYSGVDDTSMKGWSFSLQNIEYRAIQDE